MENSLAPAFVRIEYQSSWGLHSQTIPTVPYILPDVGHIGGQFDLLGAELSTPADDAVEDLIEILRPFHHTSTTFVGYTIFTQEDEDAAPQPRYAASLGLAGTNSSSTWRKAVQVTWTWRTEEFGLFKLVALDAVSGNDFDKRVAVGSGTALEALDAFVRADESFVTGRDGAQPGVFLQQAITLNEKLRKAYRMN